MAEFFSHAFLLLTGGVLSLALFLLPVERVVAEPLYVVKSSRGVVTFTSRKPSKGVGYTTFSSKRPKYSRFITIRGSLPRAVKSDYDALIKRVANDHLLEPALVKAVVHAESGFNPYATSHKGAMGLMQLMPGTAERFGVENAYHPEENVQGGVKYLRLLVDRYQGNLRLVLAAYNAGERVVDRLQEVPPYKETQVYVGRVLKYLKVYRCADAGQTNCKV